MTTQCNEPKLIFHDLDSREVVGRFDGGEITSDAGGVLLREVERRTGILSRAPGVGCGQALGGQEHAEPDGAEAPSRTSTGGTGRLRRTRRDWMRCWSMCFSRRTRGMRPSRWCWMWTRPATRCTGSRRVGSSTGTTRATATCRCTSSAAIICG